MLCFHFYSGQEIFLTFVSFFVTSQQNSDERSGILNMISEKVREHSSLLNLNDYIKIID